jgi:inositol-pentakisphosphate 2-kinase
MHSHLKSSSGALSSPEYCPLDLFSGKRARVTKAVHALWDAWLNSRGQVNNMRIFVHGKMVKPKDVCFRTAFAFCDPLNLSDSQIQSQKTWPEKGPTEA